MSKRERFFADGTSIPAVIADHDEKMAKAVLASHVDVGGDPWDYNDQVEAELRKAGREGRVSEYGDTVIVRGPKPEPVPQPAQPTMDLLVDEATQRSVRKHRSTEALPPYQPDTNAIEYLELPRVRLDPALRISVGGTGLWEPYEGRGWIIVNALVRRFGSRRMWRRWTNRNLRRLDRDGTWH